MSFGRRCDMSHLHTTCKNNYIVALVWKIILHLQDDMLKIIKRCETQKCHRRINNLHSFLHRWCIDNNGLLKVNAASELFIQKFRMNEEIRLVGIVKCKKCHFHLFEKLSSVRGMYSNISLQVAILRLAFHLFNFWMIKQIYFHQMIT